MVNKVRNDFRVYEEKNTSGETVWRIRTGGRRGDVSTSCYDRDQATETARQLNIDPWYLSRGQTRNDRNA